MSAQLQARVIEAATLEERYARGWHCLGLASEYTEKPQMLEYFGTRLAAYRGASGQMHILDAYCPHMGADLSQGCVEGDSIRCPFHAWRWGPDGVCDDIPYAKRIPDKAVTRAWLTMEENQLLFVWNDPEGNPPIEEQRIPHIDDCFSEEWSSWHTSKMHIKTNCRELVDNMADFGHFGPVHGAPMTEFSNEVEKHTYTQIAKGSSERLSEGEPLTSIATYYGPAYMNTYMTGQVDGVDVASRLLVTHIPVTTESFDLRFGVMVKKNPQMSAEENQAMVDTYVEQNQIAFGQDVDIWHNKVRVDNPVLCDGDGPVNKLRQWYQQFYMDIKSVPHSWDKKKVYQLDVRT